MNILGFSHHAISITTSQSCPSSMKAAAGQEQMRRRSCVPVKFYLQTQDHLVGLFDDPGVDIETNPLSINNKHCLLSVVLVTCSICILSMCRLWSLWLELSLYVPFLVFVTVPLMACKLKLWAPITNYKLQGIAVVCRTIYSVLFFLTRHQLG